VVNAFDDLIVLNSQLAALARGGLPLELGLQSIRGSLDGRLRELADRLQQRLSTGHSLVDALRAEGGRISPQYVAVVEAALAAGRLDVALDQLAALGRKTQEIRFRMRVALILPVAAMVLAYILFCVYISWEAGPLLALYDDLRVAPTRWIIGLRWLSERPVWWMACAPVVGVLAVAVIHWAWGRWRGDRAAGSQSPWTYLFQGSWFPGYRYLIEQWELCQLSRLLSILTEHHVPLPQALVLAANTLPRSRTRSGLLELQELLRQGESLGNAAQQANGVPMLMRQLLTKTVNLQQLSAGWGELAAIYEQRGRRYSDAIQRVIPVALLVIVGGGSVLLYCLTVFLPWLWLMQQLMVEP
jgi:general secretion pathway protein F